MPISEKTLKQFIFFSLCLTLPWLSHRIGKEITGVKTFDLFVFIRNKYFQFVNMDKKEQKQTKKQQTPPQKKNKTRKTMKIVDTSPSILV